jgi:hypothetical protein
MKTKLISTDKQSHPSNKLLMATTPKEINKASQMTLPISTANSKGGLTEIEKSNAIKSHILSIKEFIENTSDGQLLIFLRHGVSAAVHEAYKYVNNEQVEIMLTQILSQEKYQISLINFSGVASKGQIEIFNRLASAEQQDYFQTLQTTK